MPKETYVAPKLQKQEPLRDITATADEYEMTQVDPPS